MSHRGDYRKPGGENLEDRALRLYPVRLLRGNLPKKCLTMKNTYTRPGAEKTEDSFLKTNMPAPAAKPAAPVAKPQGEAAAKAEGSGAVTKAQAPVGKTEA